MKIHVCHDFSTVDEGVTGGYKPIGCNRCMEYCERCGAWHYKMSEFTNVESKYKVLSSRQFLRQFIKKKVKSDDFCQCKEYLSWVYDEMTPILQNDQIYYDNTIDKFLSGSCKLVFVNGLTGEQLATYKDYVKFLYKFLEFVLPSHKSVNTLFKHDAPVEKDYDSIKEHIHNFVNQYKSYNKEELLSSPFGYFQLEDFVKESIGLFKNGLQKSFNYTEDVIKMTRSDRMKLCDTCHGNYFYIDNNKYNLIQYHNGINECSTCNDAKLMNYRYWVRVADNVNFYKSSKNIVKRTVQTLKGEYTYEAWLSDSISKQINGKVFKK